MCTDITFIIDSLLGSATVEVQVHLLSSTYPDFYVFLSCTVCSMVRQSQTIFFMVNME